jgi:hypothetical protein
MGEQYVARVSAASPAGNLTAAMCNNAYFGLGVAEAVLGRPEEARRLFALAHEAYRAFDHRVMDGSWPPAAVRGRHALFWRKRGGSAVHSEPCPRWTA